jgi:hypothetical protein
MAADPDRWFDRATGATLAFDSEGKFVDASGNGPRRGFKNDDRFGDWLHDYVARQMEARGLHKVLVPEGSGGAPIYHTPGALSGPDRLLVLICGAGRIHVGLWSVGVCAYHGLPAGSVLPMLDKAKQRGMEVIILNPNHPGSALLKGPRQIGMVKHTLFVFKKYIINKSRNVFIVAHSMGGECTSTVMNAFPDWVLANVVAIALTDGFPDVVRRGDVRQWSFEHCINWKQSGKELDEELEDADMCKQRSAGTKDHPLTTGKAFESIWRFFDILANARYGNAFAEGGEEQSAPAPPAPEPEAAATGSAAAQGGLPVQGAVAVQRDVAVQEAVAVQGDVPVQGAVAVQGDVPVQGDVAVQGDAAAPDE